MQKKIVSLLISLLFKFSDFLIEHTKHTKLNNTNQILLYTPEEVPTH